MSATPTIPQPSIRAKYDNAAEWLHALGDIPLERVAMDPWPGTATENDLLNFVERNKRLVELIDGTLVEKPLGWDEGQIAATISYFLLRWVRPRKLGIVAGAAATLRMRSGRIRLPDVTFVTAKRADALPRPHPANSDLAPDLAVEVLSDSNTPAEMAQTIAEYFESGARLVWIVNPPSRTVAVYTGPTGEPVRVVHETEQLDGGEVLPGFTLNVADIFPPAN